MVQQKNRPAYLNLSPSDSAFNGKAKTAKFSPKSIAGDSIKEERGAMSDVCPSIHTSSLTYPTLCRIQTESAQAIDTRSRRRKIFGRSTGSQNSEQKENGSRNSKENQREPGPATPVSMSTSMPGSPSTKRPSTDDGIAKLPQRRKRSVDASKPTDRLSLFGGTLSLSRARKPAPRVQSS